jgi:hypothetical protein
MDMKHQKSKPIVVEEKIEVPVPMPPPIVCLSKIMKLTDSEMISVSGGIYSNKGYPTWADSQSSWHRHFSI